MEQASMNTSLAAEIRDRSQTQIYHITQQTGVKNITITAAGEHNCLFVIDNASVELHVNVGSPSTKVHISCIIVSETSRPAYVTMQVSLLASQVLADVYMVSLLEEGAKVQLKWGIVLSEHASGAEGYLHEENILLGEKVSIRALPMLDVRTNDLKASHGATITRLDEQKLFYMTAKWISRPAAIRLLRDSYIIKACDHVGIEPQAILDIL